ncbi:MAG: radical SAM protein [Candidatus Aegiribacteria sp.]
MLVFGPVPSRRLGRSVGINNIPPKNCTYSCVYCQVGRTTGMSVTRRSFHRPAEILEAVEEKLRQTEAVGAAVDYLTVVPDGEPTLDINLGMLLDGLQRFGIPTAAISNSSLVWNRDVREALSKADWVSLKVDSTRESTWRAVDRPHGELSLDRILEGILEFSECFSGELVTETMLVAGLNSSPDELEVTGEFLARADPDTAYISVPTRPPAEDWVMAPSAAEINTAYHILSGYLKQVRYMIHYEGEDFTRTGDPVSDLLSILSVHPMREKAVLKFLSEEEDPEAILSMLTDKGLMERVRYENEIYCLRRFPERPSASGNL